MNSGIILILLSMCPTCKVKGARQEELT